MYNGNFLVKRLSEITEACSNGNLFVRGLSEITEEMEHGNLFVTLSEITEKLSMETCLSLL